MEKAKSLRVVCLFPWVELREVLTYVCSLNSLFSVNPFCEGELRRTRALLSTPHSA